MALRPKEVVINNFKNLIIKDAHKGFSLISSNMLSFFIRKNTISEAPKVYMIENYINDVPSHTNSVVSEFVTKTVNKYYPQYKINKNLIKLYNDIDNELKLNFNDTIIKAAYDLAHKHRLIFITGSDFLNIIKTGTYNTWIKNEAYNATETDPNPDYMLVNKEKTTNPSIAPEGITIPSSLNTSEQGIYYMINSDPTEIMYLSTEPVTSWEKNLTINIHKKHYKCK